MASVIRRALFRVLDFESYLMVLSRLYFLSLRMGLLRGDEKYKYHHYVPGLLKPGDNVLDIGANLGYFSVLFARQVGRTGRVLAVEPVKPILSVLRKNVAGYPQVTIYPVALGREDGEVTLTNDSRRRLGYIASGSHSIRRSGDQTDSENKDLDHFQATMRRGSTLFSQLERLDFIKCDIEGYETVVIPELRDLIERFKPMMLIETKREKRLEMIHFLEGLGYGAYELQGQDLVAAQQAGTDDILFLQNQHITSLT